jgi:hypothetical protein
LRETPRQASSACSAAVDSAAWAAMPASTAAAGALGSGRVGERSRERICKASSGGRSDSMSDK